MTLLSQLEQQFYFAPRSTSWVTLPRDHIPTSDLGYLRLTRHNPLRAHMTVLEVTRMTSPGSPYHAPPPRHCCCGGGGLSRHRKFHVPTTSLQLGLLRQREFFLMNAAADAAIHTSVDNGVRASRIAPPLRHPFMHNDVRVLCDALRALRYGKNSVFVAVESVYSMDGTVMLLHAILDVIEGSCARHIQQGPRRLWWSVRSQ